MRTFTFSDGTSNKFWNITLQGNRFTVQFGKIGTNGQTQVKDFPDAAAAQKEHDKLVAEKLKKGYVETASSTATPAPAPAPAAVPAPAPAKTSKVKKAEPAPAPTEAPPAPPPAAPAVRTFEFSDASSHKFWNIERKGTSFTVTYGRIGTPGTTQEKSFPDEAKAEKEYDKLVAEKVKKGYRETTPAAKAAPASQREAFEQALVEHPEDLATHMAYADYLTEQGDQFGDFIRIQLALEDPAKPAAERKKLQQQEKKLLDAHLRTWMGDLAPWLLGEKGKTQYGSVSVKYNFARGWLDTLEVSHYSVEFVRTLAQAPQTRLLRRLVLSENAYEAPGEYEPGDDIPEEAQYHPQLFPLIRSPYLSNVRQFVLGEPYSPEADLRAAECEFSCHTDGEGVVGIIKQMPRVEELYLLAHRVDAEQLFSLKTFHNLRVLLLYHNHSYPLGRLAKNPSLGKLAQLLCHPHAVESDGMDENPETGGGGYIRHPAVKALVEATNLPALTHLRLRCSDMGDRGVKTLVNSGILKRLKMLDLRHGRITDVGARQLAGCADVKNLELLDLGNNALTNEGIQALTATGVNLRTEGQWQSSGDQYEDNLYLSAGDVE